MDKATKIKLHQQGIKLIEQCDTLEAFLKVAKESMQKSLKLLESDTAAVYPSNNCVYELIRLATDCQLSAARFDYEMFRE